MNKIKNSLTQEELIRIGSLKQKILEDVNDSEVVHECYDEIMGIIARHYEPILSEEVYQIVKDVSFWYA